MTKQQLENNRQWIAALRSGQYKQCRARMHDNGAHCCLGVAGVLFPEIDTQGKYPNPKFEDIFGYHCYKTFFVSSNLCNRRLDKMNDDLKWTFPQIADAIEYYVNTQEVTE